MKSQFINIIGSLFIWRFNNYQANDFKSLICFFNCRLRFHWMKLKRTPVFCIRILQISHNCFTLYIYQWPASQQSFGRSLLNPMAQIWWGNNACLIESSNLNRALLSLSIDGNGLYMYVCVLCMRIIYIYLQLKSMPLKKENMRLLPKISLICLTNYCCRRTLRGR